MNENDDMDETAGEKQPQENATPEQAKDNVVDVQKDLAEDLEQKTNLSRSDVDELNLKSIDEEYLDKRETAKLMMYLIGKPLCTKNTVRRVTSECSILNFPYNARYYTNKMN